VGHDHGVQPKDVVGAIANEADIDSQYIGRIEIYETFTTVDLPEGMPRETLAHLRKIRIRNPPALMSRVEPGQEPPPKTRAREGKVFEGKGGKFKGDKFKGAKPAGGPPGEGKFRKDKLGKKTYRAKD